MHPKKNSKNEYEQKTKYTISNDSRFDGDASVLVAERESGEYPILCTRNLVIFPTVLAPIIVGRPQSVQLAQKLIENPDKVFCIFCQKDEATETPHLETSIRLVCLLNS